MGSYFLNLAPFAGALFLYLHLGIKKEHVAMLFNLCSCQALLFAAFFIYDIAVNEGDGNTDDGGYHVGQVEALSLIHI